MSFAVFFRPELPRSTWGEFAPIIFESIDRKKVLRKEPRLFDVVYNLNGNIISYYPNSILNVLDDLLCNIGAIEGRVSAEFVIAGYPVLDIDFAGESMYFYADSQASDPFRQPLGGAYDVAQVERTLALAAQAVWTVVVQANED